MANITEAIFTVVGAVVVVVVLIASIGLLIAFPIKWTWNATMPYLFSLPTITWGRAWCLLFLCGCLIKSHHTHNSK